MLVIGGGIVGYNAAVIALGLGANVTILERSIDRMRHLDEVLSGRVSLVMSSTLQIEESVREADVVIGAVLIPGAKAPKLITQPMLSEMKQGAVFCDVAIDQGGCAETSKADHAQRARLRRRRGHPLLRREHARGGADHLDEGADERDAALRGGDRRPGPRRRGRARSGACRAASTSSAASVTYQAVAEAHGLEHVPLADVLPLRALLVAGYCPASGLSRVGEMRTTAAVTSADSPTMQTMKSGEPEEAEDGAARAS